MSLAVVHVLEVVEVHQHHRPRGPGAVRTGDLSPQLFHEPLARVERGERVVIREEGEVIVEALALRLIAGDERKELDIAVVRPVGDRGDGYGNFDLVDGEKSRLAVPLPLLDRGGDGGVEDLLPGPFGKEVDELEADTPRLLDSK